MNLRALPNLRCYVCHGPFATHRVHLPERDPDHDHHHPVTARWVHRSCCPSCHPEHLKGTTG